MEKIRKEAFAPDVQGILEDKDLKSFSTTCPGKARRGLDFTWETLSNENSTCQNFLFAHPTQAPLGRLSCLSADQEQKERRQTDSKQGRVGLRVYGAIKN